MTGIRAVRRWLESADDLSRGCANAFERKDYPGRTAQIPQSRRTANDISLRYCRTAPTRRLISGLECVVRWCGKRRTSVPGLGAVAWREAELEMYAVELVKKHKPERPLLVFRARFPFLARQRQTCLDCSNSWPCAHVVWAEETLSTSRRVMFGRLDEYG